MSPQIDLTEEEVNHLLFLRICSTHACTYCNRIRAKLEIAQQSGDWVTPLWERWELNCTNNFLSAQRSDGTVHSLSFLVNFRDIPPDCFGFVDKIGEESFQCFPRMWRGGHGSGRLYARECLAPPGAVLETARFIRCSGRAS